MSIKAIEESSIHDFYKEYIERFNFICERYADSIAMSSLQNDDSIKEFTFSEMKKECENIANLIKKVGINAGDRFAIVAQHSMETILVVYSLSLLHVTIIPIDSSLPKEEINRLLQFADVSGIYTTDVKYSLLDDCAKASIPIFIFNESGDFELYPDSIEKCIVEKQCPIDLEVAAIIFSSGTTAQMKGIMVTYKSIVESRPVYIKISGVRPGMKLLHVLPFNHIAGFIDSFFHTAEGCQLCFITDMDSSKLQKALITFKPELFAMVPKVYEVIEQKICAQIKQKGIAVYSGFKFLLFLSGISRKYFGINWGRKLFKGIYSQVLGSGIISVGSGASLCPEHTAKFFLDMGLSWCNFYASTEVGVPFITTGILDKYPYNTVGRIDRDKEIQVKINNPDNNGIGEIYAKSKLMMKGYFREPELTKNAFEDGWFKTGDTGYIDKNGYLYVTGRLKEAIMLHNGKKVAPSDIETFYSSVVDGINIVSCGISSEDGFDEIHIFIETNGISKVKAEHTKEKILELSRSQNTLYKVHGVHFIDKMPMTSVGKVKRYKLQQLVNIPDTVVSTKLNDTIENIIISIIRKFSKYQETILLSSSLRDELGLDSLSMLEIAVELEDIYNIDICSGLNNILTVNDMLLYIKNNGTNQINSSRIDISNFPAIKTKKDVKKLKYYMHLSKIIWKFNITGKENIPKSGNYIICPNHQSHLDGLWVWTAIGADNINIDKICCLAKKEHLDSELSKGWLRMLGGIPVDRSGNSAPAMKRASECLKDNYNILIHPEGTRTKNGYLGEFRNGASKLAIDSGIKIIPVCINGAFEIYPFNRSLPKFFNFRKMKRHVINIAFGVHIDPTSKSTEEVTDEIRKNILEMEKNIHDIKYDNYKFIK